MTSPTPRTGNATVETGAMPAVKRNHEGVEKDRGVEAAESPFMGMFQGFRDELDEHHDRRERIIKTSRDITAMSKKMFVLSTFRWWSLANLI